MIKTIIYYLHLDICQVMKATVHLVMFSGDETHYILPKLLMFYRNVNGFQMMYADSYMTRDEFRLMFDHTLYDKVLNGLFHKQLQFSKKLRINLPRCETSWAAEATSLRSTTK